MRVAFGAAQYADVCLVLLAAQPDAFAVLSQAATSLKAELQVTGLAEVCPSCWQLLQCSCVPRC